MKKIEELSPVAHRILDAAEQLIQQNGYNGFSYDDIAKMVGLKKPSIHHHFATKANLVAMVVQRYAVRFSEFLLDITQTKPTALAQLNAYIQLFSNTFATNRRLCVCGMLGAESAVLPSEVTEAVASFFVLNQKWLTGVFTHGIERDEFHSQVNPNGQALYLLAALEGAMIVGRGVGSDTALFEVAQAAIHAIIK